MITNPPSSDYFQPAPEDVFLVSYPRSGNTWMRVMVAELLYGCSGESIADLQHYVPDIYVSIKMEELVPSEFHVVKSHQPLRVNSGLRLYERVIYLVRDPRDVALSYYRYMTHLRSYKFGFDYFLLDLLNGRIWPCSWQEHVNSWCGSGTPSIKHKLLLIRYEDLVSDTFTQLRKVTHFLGIKPRDDEIRRAISAASVQEMRRKEKRAMRDDEKARGFRFIGAATAKQWSEVMSLNQVKQVSAYAGTIMKRFGYI